MNDNPKGMGRDDEMYSMLREAGASKETATRIAVANAGGAPDQPLMPTDSKPDKGIAPKR